MINHFKSQWRFVRGLTIDLLESLSEEKLLKTPAPSLGAWWKQFRHVGRVQENYIEAIGTKKVKFGYESGSYKGGASKEKLKEYLQNLDEKLFSMLDKTSEDVEIDWFGEQKKLATHLMYLSDHEVLHHGQWVVYQKLMGGVFPQSWDVWGL